MIKESLGGILLAVLFLAGTSYAQDSQDQNPPPQGQEAQHPHHAPPPEAIDACSGKSEGDDCSFTTPRGRDVSGTCSKTKDGQTLFCKHNRKSSS